MELDNDNDLLPAIPTADECSSISGKHIVLHVGDEVERSAHIDTWKGVIFGFKCGRCLMYPPAAGFQCNTDFDLESIFITSKSVGNHLQEKIQITQEMTLFCVQNPVQSALLHNKRAQYFNAIFDKTKSDFANASTEYGMPNVCPDFKNMEFLYPDEDQKNIEYAIQSLKHLPRETLNVYDILPSTYTARDVTEHGKVFCPICNKRMKKVSFECQITDDTLWKSLRTIQLI